MDVPASSSDRPASAAAQREPARHQFLPLRGKSLSPKHRIIVYDCKEKSLQLQKPEDFAKNLSSQDDYAKIPLPSLPNQVMIFVDSKTESKPTMDNASEDGHSNVMLAKLYLGRLGGFTKILRIIGVLSTLYITNLSPSSETSLGLPGTQNAALEL
ncbi:hypothetical protein MMC30_006776 [Trapelia coarctata]|nr:hypothetical protein [Trapelia coarctata]